MDLLDFERADLYFEEEVSPKVEQLLANASQFYGTTLAEQSLEEARVIEPESLTVLVAVFRYYYYQHNLERARDAGLTAASIAAERLGFPPHVYPEPEVFEHAFRTEPGTARFYLQSLKGVAYLNLRLGDAESAWVALNHIVALDPADRLGCRLLLELVPTRTPDAMLRQTL